jgi:hypothetical protein
MVNGSLAFDIVRSCHGVTVIIPILVEAKKEQPC